MFISRYEKWLNSCFKDGKIKNANDMFNLNGLIDYWCDELIGRLQRLFVWEGLPFPQREIEQLLIVNGYCAFVKDTRFKVSDRAVTPCTYSGVTEYPDVGTQVRWVTPVASGSFKMGDTKNGVLIRNNSLSQGLLPFIYRYATILANIDISFICALVNERSQNVLTADNKTTADSINSFYDNIEKYGKRKAIVNEKLASALAGCTALPLVQSKDSLKSIMEAYDTTLQMFYNAIGIRYNRDKKERMIESEVVSDSQRLLINVKDMLECRQEGAEEATYINRGKVNVRLSNEIVLIDQEQKQEQESEHEPVQTTAEEMKENVDYSFK